ncbi:hypothetical protein [Tessaracoccus coleopterorum]|uniref:hypothetical protein n=1 Tax=Tessaracoccus coleopterorum TaxID=2714950 RepID=UPI0018D43EDA|nr:hypothetical protein [Tessaracoccus coleopterorum]
MAKFPNADRQSVLVVASRADGGALSETDLVELAGLLPVLNTHSAADSNGPMVSEDGKAALLVTPITVGETNSDTAQIIKEVRADLAEHSPDGISLQVTGGPAFGRTWPRPSRAPTSPSSS